MELRHAIYTHYLIIGTGTMFNVTCVVRLRSRLYRLIQGQSIYYAKSYLSMDITSVWDIIISSQLDSNTILIDIEIYTPFHFPFSSWFCDFLS